MNESDFIRQQLAAEHAHLREILKAVSAAGPVIGNSRPVADYIEWARRRLLAQLDAHRSALQAAHAPGADTRAHLARLCGAAAQLAEDGAARPAQVLAARLVALLDAWDGPLDTLAGRTLRIGHWRQAAHLSADTILEERQLYAAARGAAGLS